MVLFVDLTGKSKMLISKKLQNEMTQRTEEIGKF